MSQTRFCSASSCLSVSAFSSSLTTCSWALSNGSQLWHDIATCTVLLSQPLLRPRFRAFIQPQQKLNITVNNYNYAYQRCSFSSDTLGVSVYKPATHGPILTANDVRRYSQPTFWQSTLSANTQARQPTRKEYSSPHHCICYCYLTI